MEEPQAVAIVPVVPEALSARHERFCQEYVIDLNGARSALAAGYSEASARQSASELLTKPNIQARLMELMAERNARTRMSQDYVLINLRDVVERCMVNTPVRDMRGNQVFVPVPAAPPPELDEDVQAAMEQLQLAASGDDTLSEQEALVLWHHLRDLMQPKEYEIAAVFRFDALGANKALELLGRHMKMFTDNVNITVTPVRIVDDADLHNDDIANDPTIAQPSAPATATIH